MLIIRRVYALIATHKTQLGRHDYSENKAVQHLIRLSGFPHNPTVPPGATVTTSGCHGVMYHDHSSYETHYGRPTKAKAALLLRPRLGRAEQQSQSESDSDVPPKGPTAGPGMPIRRAGPPDPRAHIISDPGPQGLGSEGRRTVTNRKPPLTAAGMRPRLAGGAT